MKIVSINGSYPDFSDLVGKIFTDVKVDENGGGRFNSSAVVFIGSESFALGYHGDCCASCDVKQIDGDLEDLIGTPILSAEETFSDEPPSGPDYEHLDSWTWTFYNIRTIKGTVTIQFWGESNGYYSETASFERVEVS